MNRLSIAPGQGRLSRSGRFVILSLEPDAELHALRPEPGGAIFKSLATLIVARDFALPSFVALDLEAGGLFLFGDLEVSIDGVALSGADSATWTEHRFSPDSVVKTAGMTPSSVDTDLVEGCVPAAGFGLNLAADLLVNDPLLIATSQAVQSETLHTDQHDDDLFDGDETEEPEESEFGLDPTTRLNKTPTEAPTPTQTPVASEPELSPSAVPEPQSAPFRSPPPVTALRADSASATASVAAQARLVCSNGQTIAVEHGLLVGRFPSKHGVPDGYDTLKVAGAEISRVHLLFTIDAPTISVQDQDTSNGSTLVGADRSIRSVPSAPSHLHMSPGDSVEFGGHSVTFEGWA